MTHDVQPQSSARSSSVSPRGPVLLPHRGDSQHLPRATLTTSDHRYVYSAYR